jgi:hypothetical protein
MFTERAGTTTTDEATLVAATIDGRRRSASCQRVPTAIAGLQIFEQRQTLGEGVGLHRRLQRGLL